LLESGPPATAFADSPIHLSPNATELLRAQYPGGKVPVIPQPFRQQLDAALLAHDWARVREVKQVLTTLHGVVTTLAWEQSRFITTGSMGLAEMHAQDVAATGANELKEAAVMLWFYAAAVTRTDGLRCNDDTAKDVHLSKLLGPEFDAVTKLMPSLPDDRLQAVQNLAIRLETMLAAERADDIICVTPYGKPGEKPDQLWRPVAQAVRPTLPAQLRELTVGMRATLSAAWEEPKQPEPTDEPALAPEPETKRAEPASGPSPR
jgi:hypothetical protein